VWRLFMKIINQSDSFLGPVSWLSGYSLSGCSLI
jgi:hypothetical protein